MARAEWFPNQCRRGEVTRRGIRLVHCESRLVPASAPEERDHHTLCPPRRFLRPTLGQIEDHSKHCRLHRFGIVACPYAVVPPGEKRSAPHYSPQPQPEIAI